MKNLIIITFVFAVLCSNLISKEYGLISSTVTASDYYLHDTIVEVIYLHEFNEKELFLIIDIDTSDYSLFLSSNSNDEISANYRTNIRKNYLISNSLDSNAIEEVKITENRNPKFINLSAPTEVKLIFERSNNEIDFSRLKTFKVSISDLYDNPEIISKQYYNSFGETITRNSNVKIAELVRDSEAVLELENILSVEGLFINEIFVDGLINLKNNSSDLIFIDGMIIFSLDSYDK